MKIKHLIFFALLVAAPAAPVLAQTYPAQPIRLIVAFPPGGANDVLARILSAEFQKDFGQSIVVENHVGAGGNIGTEIVTKAVPNGYTLLLGSTGTQAMGPALYSKLPFDPVNGLAPISLIATSGNVVLVNAKFPARNVRELIALAKAHPGAYSYGSAGNGSTTHLAGELFKSVAAVNILHVPYRGDIPAVADVAAGQLEISFPGVLPGLAMARTGKVRIIAVTAPHRMGMLPDVPTVAESGLPNYSMATWYGLFATGGTPQAVVNQLAGEVRKVGQMPKVQEQIRQQGLEPEVDGPDQFRKLVDADMLRWGAIIRKAGIHID